LIETSQSSRSTIVVDRERERGWFAPDGYLAPGSTQGVYLMLGAMETGKSSLFHEVARTCQHVVYIPLRAESDQQARDDDLLLLRCTKTIASHLGIDIEPSWLELMLAGMIFDCPFVYRTSCLLTKNFAIFLNRHVSNYCCLFSR
jgi:hypothetical protein